MVAAMLQQERVRGVRWQHLLDSNTICIYGNHTPVQAYS
jgi:hypothetical protein